MDVDDDDLVVLVMVVVVAVLVEVTHPMPEHFAYTVHADELSTLQWLRGVSLALAVQQLCSYLS